MPASVSVANEGSLVGDGIGGDNAALFSVQLAEVCGKIPNLLLPALESYGDALGGCRQHTALRAELVSKDLRGHAPLTQHARETHRRLTSRETLEDTLRERSHRTGKRQFNLEPAEDAEDKSVTYLINLPPGDNGEVPASNNWDRMLPLLRGSHYAPMHMTKRQIKVLRLWYDSLKKPWD